MSIKTTILALALLTTGAAANAGGPISGGPVPPSTTVSFAFQSGGTNVATGSFSYLGSPGVISSFGELTTFNFTSFGKTFTLADLPALPKSNGFGFDALARKFVASAANFDGQDFPVFMSAFSDPTSSKFLNGFFVGTLPDFPVLTVQQGEEAVGTLYDSYTVQSPSGAVPEPAAWAMMIGGFGLVGASARRRRSAVVAA